MILIFGIENWKIWELLSKNIQKKVDKKKQKIVEIRLILCIFFWPKDLLNKIIVTVIIRINNMISNNIKWT